MKQKSKCQKMNLTAVACASNPMRPTKITVILLLLQKHPHLRRALVNVDEQVFSSAEAKSMLKAKQSNLCEEDRLLVRACLSIWLNRSDIDLGSFFEGLLFTGHFNTAVSAVRYYLMA